MNEGEKKIVPQIILGDLKYLSTRKLYFDWFFHSGAEIAVQLLDSTIKLFLRCIGREDLISQIRRWGGDESHNVVRIIEMLQKYSLAQDFLVSEHKNVLFNLYKLYRLRYLDSLPTIGDAKTLLSDLNTIDYTYLYFRNLINISPEARKETLINKVLLRGNDLSWGEEKVSLANVLYKGNLYLKIGL